MNKEEFMKLVEPVAELVAAKGQDYQGDTVTLEQYFPFGHKSYIHMLFTKVLRLVSLAHSAAPTKFETRQDSVYDLIAYAVFYVKYLEDQRKPNPLQNYADKLNRQQATHDYTNMGAK